MTKSRLEQIADFVDRWSEDLCGRFEMRLANGNSLIIHDCHLSRDMADRPDLVFVNYDTEGQPRECFDVLDVAAIVDLEQGYSVIE